MTIWVSSSYSIPLAFPDIYSRRYDQRSSYSTCSVHVMCPVHVLSRSHSRTFRVYLTRALPSCFGDPLFLCPRISTVRKTFRSKCSSSLLITCPYQYSRLSVFVLDVGATLVVPRRAYNIMYSFLIFLILSAYPRYSSGLVSFTSIRFYCGFVIVDHVSELMLYGLHQFAVMMRLLYNPPSVSLASFCCTACLPISPACAPTCFVISVSIQTSASILVHMMYDSLGQLRC